MVDLSRLMQDAAILEVIDKSADEASNLSAQNSYQAMRIEELERENAKLRKHAENFVKCRIRANGYSDWSKEMLDDVFEDYRADFPKETDHDK